MDRRVENLIALMERDLHQKLSLSMLAQSLNLSLSYLHHLFKAETGTTPARFLRSLRMERAKQLLETTSLTIEEIMISVGIRDKSHFAREFKKAYGLTPTRHRMAARLILSAKK